jgi:hypothetical protein
MNHYISPESQIIHSHDFESALIKLINGADDTFTPEETEAVKVLLLPHVCHSFALFIRYFFLLSRMKVRRVQKSHFLSQI